MWRALPFLLLPALSMGCQAGNDGAADGREDNFDCKEILECGQGYWDQFCHVSLGDCRLELRCYDHDWVDGGGPPADSTVIDKC